MPLSGEEMVKHYLRNGWTVLRQKGRHVRLGKGKLRETIPLHRELKRGIEKTLVKRF
jgi:predicted RNA binding protein YcfA (HicA-like mRNA interferase family)